MTVVGGGVGAYPQWVCRLIRWLSDVENGSSLPALQELSRVEVVGELPVPENPL